MPIPKTGGETKGGRQVEYRSHFNFSIKWWFHPLWEPGGTAQATRVAKIFSSHYTSVAKGGGGALLWGAKLYGRVYSITVTAVLLEYRRASGTCRYQYHRTGTPDRTKFSTCARLLYQI